MAVTRKKTKQKPTKRQSIEMDRMRSFRIYPANEPFFVIRITHQTFYWLIVCLLVLALGIWTVLMTTRVHAIYDDAEITNVKELSS
ncbi:MAG TPA: hypothetical protein VFT59_02795 [Candidatus Saccharimonadales bacterium]|nr:hypothetical protein [Candidatus Saccharimonadales bacterium]